MARSVTFVPVADRLNAYVVRQHLALRPDLDKAMVSRAGK